jgi:hypothetical protein
MALGRRVQDVPDVFGAVSLMVRVEDRMPGALHLGQGTMASFMLGTGQ